jgi:hypothetical protein
VVVVVVGMAAGAASSTETADAVLFRTIVSS